MLEKVKNIKRGGFEKHHGALFWLAESLRGNGTPPLCDIIPFYWQFLFVRIVIKITFHVGELVEG